MINKFNLIFLITTIWLISSISMSADIEINVDKNDIAIEGYDPVFYFTKQKPIKGKIKYLATYKNAIYQFSSKKNRNLLSVNPNSYAPKFGGYYEMGVTMEKKFNGNPKHWKIVGGKLYLNISKRVQNKWMENIQINLETAYYNWPNIKTISSKELNSI